MRNCSNNSDQKENDNSPETNTVDTEIYNLNDRKFKIAVIRNPMNDKKTGKGNSMSSAIKLISSLMILKLQKISSRNSEYEKHN